MTVREQVLAGMRKKWNKAWKPSELAPEVRLPKYRVRQALRDMAADDSGLVEVVTRGQIGTHARESTYRYIPQKKS